MGYQGGMRDNSAEILFQSFLWEAIVSTSGTGRDVAVANVPARVNGF